MKKTTSCLIFFMALCFLFCSCRRMTPADKIKKADAQYQQGKLLEAIITLQDVVKNHPDDPAVYEAYFRLAGYHFQQNQMEEAREYLDKIIAKFDFEDQRGIMAFDDKLTTFFRQGHLKKAIEDCEQALKKVDPLNPYFVPLQIRLADFYYNDAQTTKSESVLKTIIKEDTREANRLNAMELLIGQYNKEEKFKQALNLYEDYLQSNPETEFASQLKIGIAFYHDRLGEPDKAKEIYEQAFTELGQQIEKTEEAQKKAHLMFQLARAYELQGSYEKAQTEFEKLIAAFPQSPQAGAAIVSIGELFVAQKKYDEAISYFQDIMAKYKGRRLALFAQQRISEINQQRLAAMATSPTLMQAQPTSPTAEVSK